MNLNKLIPAKHRVLPTHVEDGETLRKSIRIINTSIKRLQEDWQTIRPNPYNATHTHNVDMEFWG